MKNELQETWYKEGLRFKCTECGQCCTGSPGYVWVNEEEINEMASFLGITFQEFGKKYLRRVNGRFALIEKRKNYDCIFLSENRCQVYGARPTQCKTFPWWPQNLHSLESWKTTAKSCEGICSEAPLVSQETIEEQKLIQIRRNGNC